MLTMIGKRLMFAIPSLIGVVIVTFLLTRALPGDPAAYFAGPAATTLSLPPPLRGRVGERGSPKLRPLPEPPLSLVLPRKGGGNAAAQAARSHFKTARRSTPCSP